MWMLTLMRYASETMMLEQSALRTALSAAVRSSAGSPPVAAAFAWVSKSDWASLLASVYHAGHQVQLGLGPLPQCMSWLLHAARSRRSQCCCRDCGLIRAPLLVGRIDMGSLGTPSPQMLLRHCRHLAPGIIPSWRYTSWPQRGASPARQRCDGCLM
jgi:hypothetical protein